MTCAHTGVLWRVGPQDPSRRNSLMWEAYSPGCVSSGKTLALGAQLLSPWRVGLDHGHRGDGVTQALPWRLAGQLTLAE